MRKLIFAVAALAGIAFSAPASAQTYYAGYGWSSLMSASAGVRRTVTTITVIDPRGARPILRMGGARLRLAFMRRLLLQAAMS